MVELQPTCAENMEQLYRLVGELTLEASTGKKIEAAKSVAFGYKFKAAKEVNVGRSSLYYSRLLPDKDQALKAQIEEAMENMLVIRKKSYPISQIRTTSRTSFNSQFSWCLSPPRPIQKQKNSLSERSDVIPLSRDAFASSSSPPQAQFSLNMAPKRLGRIGFRVFWNLEAEFRRTTRLSVYFRYSGRMIFSGCFSRSRLHCMKPLVGR